MEIPDAIFGDFVIILGDEELDLGANFEVSHEIEENEADPVIDYESLIIADPLLPQLSEADIQETLGETEIVDCDINHVIGSSLGEFEEELTSFQEDYTSFRDLSTTDELLDIYSTPYTWNYGSNDFEFSSLPNEWMEDDHEPVITIIGSEISYNTDDIPCLEASDILTDVSDGQENKTPKRRSKRKCRKLPKIQDTLCPEKYQVNYSKKNLLFVPNKDGVYLKPPYSYPSMVALALFSSNQAMSVKEMYKFFIRAFPFFATADPHWKNNIRHCLSHGRMFMKTEHHRTDFKQYDWTFDPSKSYEVETELRKRRVYELHHLNHCLSGPDVLEKLRQVALVV